MYPWSGIHFFSEPKRKDYKQQYEEAKHRLERAERSLLSLTAAGALCQIGDRELYGMCVLTLAMLATGAQGK